MCLKRTSVYFFSYVDSIFRIYTIELLYHPKTIFLYNHEISLSTGQIATATVCLLMLLCLVKTTKLKNIHTSIVSWPRSSSMELGLQQA